ncbi:MAG: beta-galactosidase [Bacteroidota bacterium]|nr:beta-galactosidase [Bacteroidota bacterium]
MKTLSFQKIVFLTLITLTTVSCIKKEEELRPTIDLSGNWQFEADTSNAGINNKWYTRELTDHIDLPGTTDISHKGQATSFAFSGTSHLRRLYRYEGPAWYRKEVSIPEKWESKHIRLFLERTKPSMVWVDDQYIGQSKLLCSPQEYDLSKVLTPGKHTITLRIDNDLQLTPYGNVHIYSDDTQTNWNGIIGKLFLEASSKTYIDHIKITPDFEAKKLTVRITLKNAPKSVNLATKLTLVKKIGSIQVKTMPVSYVVTSANVIKLHYDMSHTMHLWDDYRQPLFKLYVSIQNKDHGIEDKQAIDFGLSKFATKGTHFTINGRVLFLRGKNDACVFPLTGHTPTDTESWIKLLSTAKSWGINHYRFHSWCPPEAAFEAADRLGMFLQVELPFWGQLTPGRVYHQLKEEGLAILRNYANHPSFVLFSMGNELSGDPALATELMAELKQADNRPLYTGGTNFNIGYTGPVPGSDYLVAARTPSFGDNPITHLRLSQSFSDSPEGGILNSVPPSTEITFDLPVSTILMPTISHEVGQYQVYPDFKEIEKYTGVLKADNLALFKKRLSKAGMLRQNIDFQRASGALAAICYRAEIEAALKTQGLAGFQLLDLQDYPGQGTALVGMLDAFMDSKNVIKREKWIQFTNDVVPMLSFKTYCWNNTDVFSAKVLVSNYSNKSIHKKIKWMLTDVQGQIIKSGTLPRTAMANGRLSKPGTIYFSLHSFNRPIRMNLTIQIDSTIFENSYPLWVYSVSATSNPGDVYVSNILNKAVMNQLEAGGKVLLMPRISSIYQTSLPGQFTPDFWNYGMFKSISESSRKPVSPGTLGLLMNPKHPIFNSFPTDFYSNWQWWDIVKSSRFLILDGIDANYTPIVQVIDNVERNCKLGLICEFKVGAGKLLICTTKLNELIDKPAPRQLYNSILTYMQTNSFNPKQGISEEKLKQLISYTITSRLSFPRTTMTTATPSVKQ